MHLVLTYKVLYPIIKFLSKIVVGSRALFLQRHFEGLSNWVAKSDLKLLLPSRPSN